MNCHLAEIVCFSPTAKPEYIQLEFGVASWNTKKKKKEYLLVLAKHFDMEDHNLAQEKAREHDLW